MRPSATSLRHRQLRDRATHAVEAREHDRLRRVVDDHVDAGEVLERADVATLAADDAALHVVGGQLDHRDGRLGRVARGGPLDADRDDVAHAPIGLLARLVLDDADATGHVVARALLDLAQQQLLRLRRGQTRDALERLLRVLPARYRLQPGASRGSRPARRAPARGARSRPPRCSTWLARADRRSSPFASSTRRSPSSRSTSVRIVTACSLAATSASLRIVVRLAARVLEQSLGRGCVRCRLAGNRAAGDQVASDSAEHEPDYYADHHLHRVPPDAPHGAAREPHISAAPQGNVREYR